MAFRRVFTQTSFTAVGKRNRNHLLLTLPKSKRFWISKALGEGCAAERVNIRFQNPRRPLSRCNISPARGPHAGFNRTGACRSPRHSGDTSEAMSSEYGTKVFIGDVATKVCHTQTPRAHGAGGPSREHPLPAANLPPPGSSAVGPLALHASCWARLTAPGGLRTCAVPLQVWRVW